MLTLATLRARLPGRPTIIAIAGICILGILVARSWLAAHDAALHLAATMQAQQQIVGQADDRERQRDASLAATLAKINAEKRRVDTPAKAAAAIPQALPPLPQPIDLQLPAPTPRPSEPTPRFPEPPAIAPSTVPDAVPPPATAIIPQADLKPIYDYLQDCRACQASEAVAQSDLADERNKLAAVTAQRDAAIAAARGGSFWTRLRRNAKWFALGAATAAIAASRH